MKNEKLKIKEEDFLNDPQPGRWRVENGFYVKVEDGPFDTSSSKSEDETQGPGADKKVSADDSKAES